MKKGEGGGKATAQEKKCGKGVQSDVCCDQDQGVSRGFGGDGSGGGESVMEIPVGATITFSCAERMRLLAFGEGAASLWLTSYFFPVGGAVRWAVDDGRWGVGSACWEQGLPTDMLNLSRVVPMTS